MSIDKSLFFTTKRPINDGVRKLGQLVNQSIIVSNLTYWEIFKCQNLFRVGNKFYVLTLSIHEFGLAIVT